jgi:hypothetical protein
MFAPHNRRSFLKTATVGSLAAVGDLAFLSRLQPVSADETKLDPNLVRVSNEMEPLVRLLEETPREKLLEEFGGRVRKGLSYRDVVAALLLAGVRNIQPRPVGFKFHAVLVVNSAHLASLSSPPEHRWLPIFWALDNFKNSQATNLKEGGWRMKPVDESKVPSATKAKKAFIEAMDNWDTEAADVAVAGLARSTGANEVFELFARYGCRDFRDIGHKAIFVANSWRTLNCIGWHNAEPVLRSLAYALLEHSGDNPAKRDDPADRPGRQNAELVKDIRFNWQEGKTDAKVTETLLDTFRQHSDKECCQAVVDAINIGCSPQSVWDALFLCAGELLMKQPGIVGVHCLTSTNALRYAYETCANDETRRLLMLQNAAFLPLFLGAMKGRGKLDDARIDQLEPIHPKGDSLTPDAVFAHVGKDRPLAAGQALGFLKDTGNAKELIDTARVLVFLKGADSHDYKFSSAVLEDYYNVSPEWRDRYLAANTYWLRGTSQKDNSLVQRTRAALKG